MLPWRNYFTTSLIMIVVIVFCASLAITREKLNNYNENRFAVSYDKKFSAASAWDEEDETAFSVPRRTVLYFGNTEKDPFGGIAKQWCLYTKRTLRQGTNLESLTEYDENAEVLLICPDYLSDNDISLLTELSDKGMSMVFMKLPEKQYIADSIKLRKLLGVSTVDRESCHLDGIRLFPGFLIGGTGEYIALTSDDKKKQDMKLDVDRYHIRTGTKVYMTGVLNDETLNEEMPPLIWRASSGNAMVFSVNGDYLNNISGIGILDAIMYELHECELYPVVNSQLFSILSGPDISAENTADIEKLYGRDLNKTYRELVLPTIASMSGKLNFPMNGMIMLKGDINDPEQPKVETLVYYLKWFNEYHSELGISVEKKEREAVEDILDEYEAFFESNDISYQFKCMYAGAAQAAEVSDILDGGSARSGVLKGINTVICPENSNYPLLGYIGENVTLQSVTNDGYSHTFSEDLRFKSLETALGYSNISADMFKISFPEEKSKHWDKLSNMLSDNVISYWYNYDYFDKNTMSESDKRVRQFLKLDYSYKIDGNKILVETDNIEDKAWFILRTHGEKIGKISGGSWKLMEDNTYLIEINGDTAEISFKPKERKYYNDSGSLIG